MPDWVLFLILLIASLCIPAAGYVLGRWGLR